MIEQGRLYRTDSLVRPTVQESLTRRAQRRMTLLLRFSLAAIFFWFGMLKLTGVSPVLPILQNSMPILAKSPCFELLGCGEVVIALGLVIERLARHATTLMMLHLACTLSIVLIAPALVFAPSFPVLTIEGEFLAKNVVFIMAGLVILASRRPQL